MNGKAFVTKQDLGEAVDAILNGMENFATKEDVAELKHEIVEVKEEVRLTRRELNDLKVDTPTQGEFDGLKKRFEKHETHLAAR